MSASKSQAEKSSGSSESLCSRGLWGKNLVGGDIERKDENKRQQSGRARVTWRKCGETYNKISEGEEALGAQKIGNSKPPSLKQDTLSK